MTFFVKNNRRQGNRKLGYGQVEEIRVKYNNGATQSALCREYGMSVGQIGRIVRGESWADSPDAVRERITPMPSVDMLAELSRQVQAGATPSLVSKETQRKADEMLGKSPLDGGGNDEPTNRITRLEQDIKREKDAQG